MEWIVGIQKSLDYIESPLTESLDYENIAAQSFSSSYHFQRVFSILCGFTIGEYIRNRRLTLAGEELLTGSAKIIDIALKYGYENPDSFARAFQKFHGILPSQVRNNSGHLKSFSRLVLRFSLEGESIMNYRLEKKPEMVFTGYKRRFSGNPAERVQQENDFYRSTRVHQYILKGWLMTAIPVIISSEEMMGRGMIFILRLCWMHGASILLMRNWALKM